MRFIQLYLAVLAALVSVAMADVMHVPLRKRAHGGHRLLDRNGQETDVVNMAALRRSINHVNGRYGVEAGEKRWVDGKILNKPVNLAFAQQEDDIQNGLLSSLKTMAGKLLPQLGGSDGEDAVSVAQSKTKYRAATKSKGRYTGAAGTAKSKIALTDNVSGGTDIEFVGDILIGTPAQKFPIDPDTGSADLWVVDQTCQAKECGPNSRGKFTQSKSKSYATVSGAPQFELQYGIGDVSGRYARETVQFGSIKLQKQTIGLANHTSPDWEDDLASGVLGLGFRAITSNGQRPVIQNLASQGKLKSKIVSFAFGRHASGTEAKSEMRIGATNKNLIKGAISYYPLTKVAYWQAKVGSFAAGSGTGVQNADGIFDTGTSLIAAPAQQAAAFWKGVPSAKLSSDGTYYSYPCSASVNAKLTMPDGRSFTLNEKDLNLGRDSAGSSTCVGAVIVASTPGQIIYGLAALKNFYQVYDFGQNRIGMATYNF